MNAFREGDGLYAGKYRIATARCTSWNYANPGWYFVTFCTHGRRRCLSGIVDGEAVPSAIGRIVVEEWERTPLVRPTVELGPFVVMPDHVHALIRLKEGSQPLGVVVNQIKSNATKRIRATLDPAFRWQARYHDRIVRDLREWDAIARYIERNPTAWESQEPAMHGEIADHEWDVCPYCHDRPKTVSNARPKIVSNDRPKTVETPRRGVSTPATPTSVSPPPNTSSDSMALPGAFGENDRPRNSQTPVLGRTTAPRARATRATASIRTPEIRP